VSARTGRCAGLTRYVRLDRTIDQGIELLTGRPAGERHADGSYPEGSVNALAEGRLGEYAERLIVVGAAVGAVLIARRAAAHGGEFDFEGMIERMPENAPPKWMFRNISAIRANTRSGAEGRHERMPRTTTPPVGNTPRSEGCR
jgi:hypothetical protein